MKQTFSPTMHDLRMECVLVQAWKKTAAHIRQHSWYADTLELDYQSLRLPLFIEELQSRLQSPLEWISKPLDLVPAPKPQRWELREGKWQPKQGEKPAKKLHPLAHVDLQDQVVANGGALKDACRAYLNRLMKAGQISSILYGEEYSLATNAGRNLMKHCPDLRGSERSDSQNPGITFVEL